MEKHNCFFSILFFIVLLGCDKTTTHLTQWEDHFDEFGLIIVTEADATLPKISPSQNQGSELDLRATSYQGDEAENFLVRFSVPSISRIHSVALHFFATDASEAAGVNISFIDDNMWEENTVTWDNAPASSKVLGLIKDIESGYWYELDVSSIITGEGIYTFRVSPQYADMATFASREASPLSPRLTIVLSEDDPPIEINDVSQWLETHPKLRDAIAWQSASGTEKYTDWSTSKKSELQDYFLMAMNGQYKNLVDPPPNMLTLEDDDYPTTVLAEEHAWPLYLSYVAHTLAFEASQSLPWTITEYSEEALYLLLDSQSMFHWDSQGYRFWSMDGRALPAPPDYTYSFLVTNDLIGQDKLSTIGKLLNWGRNNLTHYTGGPSAGNNEINWQYRGIPPVSGVIDGTYLKGNPPKHPTAGCHGTTGFLRSVLRAVNIPAKKVSTCGHAQPYFVTEEKYLTHGDDLYNALARVTPPYPAETLLISQEKHSLWFSAELPKDEKCNNIGRQVYELAIENLSDYVLRKYCGDLEASTPKIDSDVYKAFERYYTLSELESLQLWVRLDAKVQSLGGCEEIP